MNNKKQTHLLMIYGSAIRKGRFYGKIIKKFIEQLAHMEIFISRLDQM